MVMMVRGRVGRFSAVLLASILVFVGSVAAAPASSAEIGVDWTNHAAAESNFWSSVTYGNGVFVAVSRDGAHQVMTSPDGETWTARTAAEANRWESVTFGNGLFVAVASIGIGTHLVMTSPDGITWTARSQADDSSWSSVTYGNGVFVAVAGGTNKVMTSADGLTWTLRTAVGANAWTSVTFGNGLFVATATSGASRVMTSPDGLAWTGRTAAEANSWQSVTYGGGIFVAVAYDGTNRVMTSVDGSTWTSRSAAAQNLWTSVVYGNGIFVALSATGVQQVMTSADGVTWTARSAASSELWWAVTYANGIFVGISLSKSGKMMTSGSFGVVPGAPTVLTATPSDGSASIAFTAGSNGGRAIPNYKYQLDGGSWVALSPADSSSPVTIPGLSNGTTYSVALRAVNSVGDGAVSAPVSLTPRTVPSAPTSLVATPSNGSASIAFVPGSNGGALVSKYQYRIGSGSWVDAGSTSPITVSGLTNYTTSSIRLRAVNAAGGGAASEAVTVRPKLSGPTLGVAYSAGRNGAIVGFAFIRPIGSTLVGFTVRAYAKDTPTVVSSCQTTPSGRSCYIGSLVSGIEYDIRVQAYFRATGSATVRETSESATSRVRINN